MWVHVIADVHGNGEALARAGEGADALLVLGDLIDFIDDEDPQRASSAGCSARSEPDGFARLRSSGPPGASGRYLWRHPHAVRPELGASGVQVACRAMAEESTQSIVIAANPERIIDVIADFAAYPDWADAVTGSEVLSVGPDGRAERVRFNLDKGPVKDEYVLGYEWAADGLSVRWHLVDGQMQKAQNGSYVLQPAGDQTTVTYRLTVELAIPMIGMLKRKAEKVIMDTALNELKRRVEA